MKRTKIICTIGPASRDVRTLVQMGRAGMDIVRLNFSHGTHDEHELVAKHVRLAGKQLGRPFAILQDLQGPKIRVGNLPERGVKLVKGALVTFSTADHPAEGDIPVTLSRLHHDLKKGDRVLLDDGKLDVHVERVDGRRIMARVVQGGLLSSHKGMNIPGASLRIPALSEKDRADARFGVQLGVDFIALSFVRNAEDIKALRSLLDREGKSGKGIKIVVKLEKPEAVERFDEILRYADAVMVARGDLGIELPAADVPVVQKEVVERCRQANVPVIVATHMLESMIQSARPTRAEVSDVANAVSDHADAVMLSGESAVGKNPVDAVKIMSDTIDAMEQSRFDNVETIEIQTGAKDGADLGPAVRILAETLGRPPIVICDDSGELVRAISAQRPEAPMYVPVADERLGRQFRISWGIIPIFSAPKKRTPDDMIRHLRTQKLVKRNTRVIVVSRTDTDDRIEIRTV